MNDLDLQKKEWHNLDSFMDFLPVLSLWVTNDFKIQSVNENLLSLIRKTKTEVIGTDLRDYPFTNLMLYLKNRDSLDKRELVIIDTFEVQKKKKTLRFYVKETNLEKSLMVIGVDLSGDIAKNEANEEARAYYEDKARTMFIDQIASGVAHEINNPLSIISGFLSQMKKGIEGGRGVINLDSYLDKINKSKKCVDRIAMIVRGLKFLTKHDQKEALENIHLENIISGALDLCLEKFKISDINLKVVGNIPDVMVVCRPIQLTQVIINLLINSRDAVEDEEIKWIEISFLDTIKSLTVSVTDSGKPIAKEVREKMMQPFFTTKDNKGAGLGLSASKSIAENNKGKLVFDEDFPHTRFSLILEKN